MIVKLRKRKCKNGKASLYLAFWNPDCKYQVSRGKNKGQWKYGRWEYEFLKLYLDNNQALNRETMKLAENIKAKRQLELQARNSGLKSNATGKENLVTYFEDIRDKKYPGRNNWTTTLKHLKDFTGGEIPFKDVNKEWLEKFKTYLLSKVSRNSASCYFDRLKSALKMATNNEIIDKYPCKNVKSIKLVEVKKVYLTIDEIKSLVNAPCQDENVKRSFLFGCFTGLRVSDLMRLTREDIQKDDKGLKIEFRQKKTKGFEYLPLSQTAIKFFNLEELKKPDDKIFNIPPRYVYNRLFDQWTKAAGVKKHVRYHTARHTFATLSLTNGVDLYTVSKLLGHRTIATTQVYAKVVDEKKRDAVNMLPVLQRP